jgi:hypothetical protein
LSRSDFQKEYSLETVRLRLLCRLLFPWHELRILTELLLVFLASYRGNMKAAPIMTVGKMAHRTALPLPGF